MWITKGKKWLYGIASFCTLPGKEGVADKFPSQEIEDKKIHCSDDKQCSDSDSDQGIRALQVRREGRN